MQRAVRFPLMLGLLAVACGADSRRHSDASGGGATATAGSPAEGGSAGSPGEAGNGGDAVGGAVNGGAPVGVATGSRVFSGTASMLFDGPSCAFEEGALSDRWCAFVARSSSNARNLFVVNVSQTTTSVPFLSVRFSPNAEALVWARSKPDGFDGLHTLLSDCSTEALAPDVVALGWVGHGPVIFMDAFDPDAGVGSMRFRHVTADTTLEPGAPTLVADSVDTYAISGPAPGALLYTVNGGGDADGVYVRWFEH